MADNTPAVDPPNAAPVEPSTAVAEPTRQKQVVLATHHLREFIVPGPDGEPQLHITSAGVAMSRRDADTALAAAQVSGVELLDITESATQAAEQRNQARSALADVTKKD